LLHLLQIILQDGGKRSTNVQVAYIESGMYYCLPTRANVRAPPAPSSVAYLTSQLLCIPQRIVNSQCLPLSRDALSPG
jgi:hypothetical protein